MSTKDRPQQGWIRIGLGIFVLAVGAALLQCNLGRPTPRTAAEHSDTIGAGRAPDVYPEALQTSTEKHTVDTAGTSNVKNAVSTPFRPAPTPNKEDIAKVRTGGMGMGGMGMGMGKAALPPYSDEMGLLPMPTSAEEIQNKYFPRVEELNSFLDLTKQTCSVDWTPSVLYQLSNWKDSGFTKESLDKHCLRKSVRISIVNGRIRVAWFTFTISGAQRIICMLWLLQLTLLRAAAAGRPIPDVELVAQTSDGAESSVGAPFHFDNAGPLFSNVKCNEDASISFPMGFHDQFGARASGAMSFRMYREFWKELDALNADSTDPGQGPPAWDKKEPTLFFSAGSQAGRGRPKTRGYRKKLFNIDSERFVVVPESHPLSDYAKHKYLVYAYGRCGWSRRIRELAFMEAVLFVESSNCSEYFMHSLVPNKDYVPVAEDFSDLAGKVDEIHGDQKKAKKLAANWLTHARSLLSLECVLDYIENLLVAYGPLQRFTPTERTSWKLYDMRNPDAHTVKFFQFEPLPEENCPGLKSAKKNNHQKLNC